MSRVSRFVLVLVAALGTPIAAQAPATTPPRPLRQPRRRPIRPLAGGPRRRSGTSAQPWLVGANYTPANAINQLEMWQADTFDPARIDRELGWAEDIGMNTMRVFLHDLVWQQDAAGYKSRIDQFLAIADKHHIRPMLVLFDSVWDPLPKLGKQHEPTPGVHNSGWVQGPGAQALQDPSQHAAARSLRHGRRRRLRQRSAASSRGTSGTSRTTPTAAATRTRSRPTSSSSCWRCCRRCSRGRGRPSRRSP